jgi:hypothetical protein
MTETRYGLQPAYAHVLKQCGSTRVAADLLNVKATHLRRALNGVTPINDRVREGLPILLRLSAVELFTPWPSPSVPRQVDPSHGRAPVVSPLYRLPLRHRFTRRGSTAASAPPPHSTAHPRRMPENP